MNISPTAELETAVKTELASGLYNNASDVISEFFTQEHKNQWLTREAAVGYKQLQAGQATEVKSKQHFIDLVRS